MAEQQGFLLIVDGQEVAVADYVNVGRTAGLATDRVLAELLRFPAYDGTNVYKSILPSYLEVVEGGGGATATNPGIVTPGPGSNGSVQINPFTAIVGSRAAPGAVATDPTWPPARQNLSDIRTAVYTGSTTLATSLALAANASGNPRQDLIYATVSVDSQAGSTVRRVKNATSGALSTQNVPTLVANTVTVNVVTGTPGASPTLPALPADSAGNYNILIGAVWVPNGFTSGSTVLSTQIRSLVGVAKTGTVAGSAGQTVAMLAPSSGAHSGPFPASGNNDRSGTYAANFPWGATRSKMFLPPTMVGGVQCFGEVDLVASVSHATGGIVDDTIDWRNRFVMVFVSADATALYAADPAYAGGNTSVPYLGTSISNATANGAGPYCQMNNTFMTNSAVSANKSPVLLLDNAKTNGQITSPGFFGLYVDPADGILRVNYGSPIAFRFFFWLMASAQFPNR